MSVLLRSTASHYSFGIFWSLYCLYFYALPLLITPLIYFGHCIVCPSTLYGFSLLLWYLLAIALSVLLRFTSSHYPFGIFWPLYCLSFYALRLLITPLVSFGHCIVCPSTLYGFSLPLWYLLAIVLSVLRRFTASHYPFGIFWPLYCLSFYALWLLITPLVSFGHCIVCPSTLYGFSLLLWYLLAIVLSVLLRFTASHYSFGIFWSLYCLSFYAFTASHYFFGIFWPLYCLSFYALPLLITLLVYFGHCIVCHSTLYGFSLLLWYLLAIVLSVLLRFTASHYSFGIFWSLYCLSFYAFTASHYFFGIFWPLYCLSFYDLRLLITLLVSFGRCIVCPSTLYGFSLPLWYLLAIVLSVLLRFTASHYSFGIFWPLFCLSFYALRLLITPLVSFGHCIVCHSTLYGFSLILWYLLAIVLSVLLRFTASHYSFGIFWSLYFLSLYALRLLITPLVSFGHCIVCPSTLLRLLITPLVSFGHCIVCPSRLHGFSLPFWYLLAIVLSVHLRFTLLITPLVSLVIVLSVLVRFTASHYSFGIFWPLHCLSFYALRLLITPLVSFGHCTVCPSTLYGFSLLL